LAPRPELSLRLTALSREGRRSRRP
jgi:hypothetical protein